MTEKPLYYSCEHGASNTPDACIFRVYPDAQEMPEDWFTDRWMPYLGAPESTLAKLDEMFRLQDAGVNLPGTVDSASV